MVYRRSRDLRTGLKNPSGRGMTAWKDRHFKITSGEFYSNDDFCLGAEDLCVRPSFKLNYNKK